ncbi:MAG: hypothetical protein RR139_06315 [Lachnospiraceae bacterium]
MGEIIFSICVGGFLILSGITMNIILRREEKQFKLEKDSGEDCN